MIHAIESLGIPPGAAGKPDYAGSPSQEYNQLYGNTPLVKLNHGCNPLIRGFAKLEFCNPTGSVKDRAAAYILRELLRKRIIDADTTIIESSSGNFGIALAAHCRSLGLKFICVIDERINEINEMLIGKFGGQTIKALSSHSSEDLLKQRLSIVQRLMKEIPNAYWINQYGNPLNSDAYYNTLGAEIGSSLERIDYVFIGVSSGGTIAGVSRKIKEQHPASKIIAVDVCGSVIFGGQPKKRFIPGIGSSINPAILETARIDDVVMVEEADILLACDELISQCNIFAGGSSGAVFLAMKNYFAGRKIDTETNVVMVFPDRGDRYFGTLYNKGWRNKHFGPTTQAPIPMMAVHGG